MGTGVAEVVAEGVGVAEVELEGVGSSVWVGPVNQSLYRLSPSVIPSNGIKTLAKLS